MKILSAVVVCVAVAAGTTGCSGDEPDAKVLRVYAAASLKQAFTEIGATFEEKNPGVTVEFNFAGSSDLATQLKQGAPADVFASADPANMKKVADDGLLAGGSTVFASNILQIAVPPKNPRKINSLADLTGSGIKVVVCAPQVPCGSATQKVLRAASLTLKPVSEESSVTDVLNKVVTGEADAGLVYHSDVRGAAGKVEGINFEQSRAARNKYPIAVLRASEQSDLAKAFIGAVAAPKGQSVLGHAGFQQAFPVE